MNTDQIYELLWNDVIVSAEIMAVIPCNALKYVPVKMTGCYVVNCNEKSYLRGDVGHWIFLRIHGDGSRRNEVENNLEIFDAQGETTYNREMEVFMRQFENCSRNYSLISNEKCGFYSLVYAYYRCRKLKRLNVLNILKDIGDVKEHCMALYGDRQLNSSLTKGLTN